MSSLTNLIRDLYSTNQANGITTLNIEKGLADASNIINLAAVLDTNCSKDEEYCASLKNKNFTLTSNSDLKDVVTADFDSLQYTLIGIAKKENVLVCTLSKDDPGFWMLQDRIFKYEQKVENQTKATQVKEGYISIGPAKIEFNGVDMKIEEVLSNVKKDGFSIFSKYSTDVSLVISAPISAESEHKTNGKPVTMYDALTAQSKDGNTLRARLLGMMSRIKDASYVCGTGSNLDWILSADKKNQD